MSYFSDLLILWILLALLVIGAASFFLSEDGPGQWWDRLRRRGVGGGGDGGPPYDDDEEPVRMVMATVANKRVHVLHGLFTDDAITKFYITFAVESNAGSEERWTQSNRWELNVSSDEYDQMATGDDGLLTYQGRSFLAFTRPPQI